MAYKTVTVKLKSHSEVFIHKPIEDFTGMYMALADVTAITQNGAEYGTESYRVDIIKTGDNTVSIKGLCNYFDFSPEVKGTYNELTGCIEIAPQSVGKYKGYEIRFGLSGKLYSTVWQIQYSLQIGFSEDGKLYFRSNPANDTKLTGYKFLVFSGGSYAGGDIANKTYDNISMSRIQ